jgi:anti-sigma regulatory factor (Ser/Thr protein kinase)
MTMTVLPPPAETMAWWDHRRYACDLAQVGQVRRDLADDLAEFDSDVVASVQLCAAELAANAVKYAPGGGFSRALAMPTPSTLWLAIIDEGCGAGLPCIPSDRTTDEWEVAEGQRGLLLVDALAKTWGHYPVGPGSVNLGIGVWATFVLEPGQVPVGIGGLIMSR